MTDKLHPWEKAPIVGLFIAQGLYVWQWYVGERMPDALAGLLGWFAAVAGLAAWAAIDGAMIATVAGMRAGRRSRWSGAAIVTTAAFGAAVALDLYGAFGENARGVPAWLHAGFALTIVCYLLHLAQPVVAARAARPAGTRGRARLVRGLVGALRSARAEARSYQGAAAQAQERAAHLAAELAQARAQAAQAERDRDEAAAQAGADTGLDARTVAQWLAQANVSGREIARRLGVAESTVRSWTKPARASAAD